MTFAFKKFTFKLQFLVSKVQTAKNFNQVNKKRHTKAGNICPLFIYFCFMKANTIEDI